MNGRARGDLVQAVFLVLLGERVAEPLPGDHVHEHRAAEVACPAQRVLDHLLVVAVDGPEVLQAEVLEEHLRLQHVLDALLDPVQRLVQRRADQRRMRQRGLDVVEDVLVALGHADGGEVVGEAADRRLVGAAVVVDDDHDAAAGGHRDVVQGLPGHAAGQRAVADDRHHGAVRLAAQPVGLGQAVGVAQAGGGVRVLDHVVLGLGPARVTGHPAALPQRPELRLPTGEQLVHVGLVPDVEHDPVDRRVEDPVQRDGQLDDAEVRPQVTAGSGYRLDQDVTNLAGQPGQLVRAELLQVPWARDRLQQRHRRPRAQAPSFSERRKPVRRASAAFLPFPGIQSGIAISQASSFGERFMTGSAPRGRRAAGPADWPVLRCRQRFRPECTESSCAQTARRR